MPGARPDVDGRRVLVTGGSGVVGSALIRHLIAAGAEVAALARSAESAAGVRSLGAVPVEGDVLSLPSLHRACAGREFVFHVAGVNELCPSDPDGLWRVNVDGTRNVVRAANQQSVRRLVLTSSVAALGAGSAQPVTESATGPPPSGSLYARSKWASEQVAMTEAGKVEVVAVNPASVQGPGRSTGTGRLLLDLINGRLPFMVDTTISIVDIDDCSSGHLAAAERGAAGERYILSGFTLHARDAVAMLEAMVGLPLGIHFVSRRLASLVGPLAGPVSRAFGGPRLCHEAVRTMSGHHAYDGSRAERDLGLRYRTPEDTMQRFLDWAGDEGLIERTAGGRPWGRASG